MHQNCWMPRIITDWESVCELMWLMDGNRVNLHTQNCLRRHLYNSGGPNYVWHVDRYDKLKPFGICISGCIDGFSRKKKPLSPGIWGFIKYHGIMVCETMPKIVLYVWIHFILCKTFWLTCLKYLNSDKSPCLWINNWNILVIINIS